MMPTHFEMVDRVNDVETEQEHLIAEAALAGWRMGVESTGQRWSGIDADLHSMARFEGDRPMCCGVLLDWTPAPPLPDNAVMSRPVGVGSIES